MSKERCLHGQRRVLARERRAAKEPVLDGVAWLWHRRVGAGLVQEHLVEQKRIAGFKDGPNDRRLAGGLLRLLLRDCVVKRRVLGGGGDEVIESARKDVESGSLVPAARQRQPQVK